MITLDVALMTTTPQSVLSKMPTSPTFTFDTSIPSRDTLFSYDDVEVQDVRNEEYPDLYARTNTNTCIPFFTTEHVQSA